MIKFLKRITKNGNSSAVTIPKELLISLGLKNNDTVHLYLENDKIILEKTKK